jgi:hypothetical protein
MKCSGVSETQACGNRVQQIHFGTVAHTTDVPRQINLATRLVLIIRQLLSRLRSYLLLWSSDCNTSNYVHMSLFEAGYIEISGPYASETSRIPHFVPDSQMAV